VLYGYRFDSPLILLLLIFALPLVWWLRRPLRRPALGLSSFRAVVPVRPSWRVRVTPLLYLVRVAAAVLIVLALARPQRGEANAIVQNRGIDIVLAQDLSGSMSAAWGPQTGPGPHETRLSASKRLAAQFVGERKDDRIGLIGFESETRLLSPLTEDHAALADIIGRMQNGEDGLPDGTAIGAGLSSALNILRGSSSRSRVIVLLTDGEENVHQIEPSEAAKLAKTLGIRVYTVGIIDPRTMEVDVNVLKGIAEPTGGAYFPATSPQALNGVYDRINQLVKTTTVQTHFYRYDELAPWLLVPAILLLFAEAFLTNVVLRRTP
jgi:Ca-activated chloride channel family protein